MAADDCEDSAYQARLDACTGEASAGLMVAPHAVSEAMIAMWADALLDDNPVYVDDAAARATGRDGIIAPPTMIQAWIMPKLSVMAQAATEAPGYAPWIRGRPSAAGADSDGALEIYRVLAERGYTNSAATNCRQDYHRELRPGDRIRAVTTLEKVSGLKRTAMGHGHFITTRYEFYDQDDRNVATQLWTVLRFRTPDAVPMAPPPAASEAVKAGGPLRGVPRIGQLTEATVIPITPSWVVTTAIATHDFYAIHHDTDWARSIGRPDIFQNILTTTGLVGGVVTRWGGPAVRLRSVDLRLLAPNYPGDECSFVGQVIAVEGDQVTMAVRGTNGIGVHVDATVVATVPASGT